MEGISNNPLISSISTVTLGPLTEDLRASVLLCDTVPANLIRRDTEPHIARSPMGKRRSYKGNVKNKYFELDANKNATSKS